MGLQLKARSSTGMRRAALQLPLLPVSQLQVCCAIRVELLNSTPRSDGTSTSPQSVARPRALHFAGLIAFPDHTCNDLHPPSAAVALCDKMAMQSKTFVACCIAVASTCFGAVDTATATSAAVYRPKRGYVADGCTGSNCTDPTLLTSIGWYYAYNVGDPYCSGSASTTSSTLRGSHAVDESAYTCSLPLQTEAKLFTPMHWCIDNLNDTVPSYVNTTFMMGYNEPNNAHNCNKDATTVAQSWSRVMSGWQNSILVSPATAGNGIPWYDEFFAACKSLYGPSGCNITHMATHDYSCNADTTMGYLKELYDRYKLPIW